jgi:Fe-S-cluster containining protein
MVLGFLGALFGARNRLPRDQVTRVPRSAKKAAAQSIEGMTAALTKLSALPGIADIKEHKRVPRGFYALVDEFLEHADAYQATARRYLPIVEDEVRRPGEPGGTGGCYPAPLGVSGIEALNIYRHIRPWRDFQDVARSLAELGEQQFKDIQAGHSGKNPEKIRMGGRAVREGRITFAKRMQACPFLDQKRERCRIWEQRPIVCRMHHITTPELARPDHEAWPIGVKAKNIRLPVKVQVALAQLDKRMMLQASPFLYAGVLQLLQLAEGHPIQEVGEAPQRMQQDGQVARKANRNVRHAAKFKKKKKKK